MPTSLRLTHAVLCGLLMAPPAAAPAAEPKPPADGQVVKAVLGLDNLGENLAGPDRWRPYERGFERDAGDFVCRNGADAKARRGAAQTVVLDQKTPEPIVAVASSKAEGVTGSPGPDYSIYLDLQYQDGTPLWGQTASIDTGTHDWQERRVVVVPEKPVKSVTMNLLLRGHGGTAWFREPRLHVIKAPEGACLFDGVPVMPAATVMPKTREEDARMAPGFQVRDVAAASDFVRIEREALGLRLHVAGSHGPDLGRAAKPALYSDVTLSDTTGKDRAVTLVYAIPVVPVSVFWLQDPRREVRTEAPQEYVHAGHFRAGANGRLSLYPLGAIVAEGRVGSQEPPLIKRQGIAVGIDMARPAFFRVGFNKGTGELFLAYDIGLTPEMPSATVRFCTFTFDPAWGFRSALARYYEAFPEAFQRRTPEQGLWMPFAKISRVKDWQDFGFKFKEGNDETAWDDEHGILTFRYTEPMTWWMTMPKEMPRTMDAALAEARRLAEQGNAAAKALFASGYHNQAGQFPARLLDTPWCNGAVWSMNSMPGIPGEVTDFKIKWNDRVRESLYGPGRKGDLDGEYVDSSEGYVTDELDFRRDHFAAADTPLCFSPHTHRPAVFRGLVAFEYVRGIAKDVHGMGKLMMANGAPTRLPWLCPMLEVLGTETNWHYGGQWRPMSDADLLYRRALCKGKPYCFLMNTEFEKFGPDLVERYMRRCLAYGMFPGFFSHNASQGHYFTRPELYDRDRPLFKKYVPLCKRVAEAGWEPVTLARSSDERVYVERFGSRYLTVFNDSPESRTAAITLDGVAPAQPECPELVRGGTVAWKDGKATVTLASEDVAVIDLRR